MNTNNSNVFRELLRKATTSGDKIANLIRILPGTFQDLYQKETGRISQIVQIHFGTFTFLYDTADCYQMTEDSEIESRVVAAFGLSVPNITSRDDARLRGWIGDTEKVFGESWDKGHFIAHSMGGFIDGMEINVFQQNRKLNRGWNGNKLFRQFEKYCSSHANTFFFNRPVYSDESAIPAYLEFGYLDESNVFRIEVCSNH